MNDIQSVRNRLIEASNAYYNLNVPIMSDMEFDQLRDQLKTMSPNDPYLYTIGAPIPQHSPWQKATHKIPMGSLDKITNIDGMRKWFNNEYIYTVTEKLDGISIDLEYESGKFLRAITRGDGKIGEDITPNVKKMQGFKSEISNFTGSIRGEILFTGGNFKHVNQILETCSERPLKTMRNGASGIAKRRDGKYSEFLSIIYYDVTGKFEYKHEKLNWLTKQGLEVPFVCNAKDIETLINKYEEYEDHVRQHLSYEIDGLVVEIGNMSIQHDMGYDTQGLPKCARAWKFGPIRADTDLLAVDWQVGASGRITPVARVKPVAMAGVTVSNVTLHNLSIFEEMKLTKDAIVQISRRGDVIPYIEKVVKPGTEIIEIPNSCPVCDSKLERKGKYLECKNAFCSAKTIGLLKNWVVTLGLKGISDATIERLVSANLLVTPADFYDLKIEDIEKLPGFGKRSAETIVSTIQSKREVTIQEFIAGLMIPNFGMRMANILAQAGYDDFSKIEILTHNKTEGFKQLSILDGIGEKTAVDFLDSLVERKLIALLILGNGISIVNPKPVEPETTSMRLSGQSFVFTGKIESTDSSGERYTRKRLQELVIANGGITSSSIKQGVTYLVQADPTSESSKTKKAKTLGIKIIGESEFFELLT